MMPGNDDVQQPTLDSREMQDPADRATTAWVLVLAGLATLAQLYLVWGFQFFPSVDGPAHTHLAYAMYEALRGDGFYAGLVELNPRINPNIATQAMLVGLMAVAPPFVAEKLLLTLYFVAFACAGGYALAGINRRSLCLLPLLVFCSISLPLAFGFYNFAFSTVVFLAWFGYWWRHRHVFGMRVVIGHALFAALACVTHIFAFAITVFAIGVTGLAAILSQATRRGLAADPGQVPRARAWLTHAVPPLLGSLPWLVACLYFLLVRFRAKTLAGAADLNFGLGPRLQDFLAGTSFAPYDNVEFMAAAILAPVLVGSVLLLAWKSRDARRSLPFAACFAAFLLLYLAMPPQWVVRWMPQRMQPLVSITLLLWLASLLPAMLKPLHARAIGAAGLALVALGLAVRIPVFERLDAYYREYASAAPRIARNSTLVSLRLHPAPAKLDVYIQAGSRIASLRHSVDLKNFQGQAEDHPIQFRPGVGAAAALGGDGALISLSPRIDLMAYERKTGRPIDYILVHGFRQFAMNPPGLARLDQQLGEYYQLEYVSKPRGFVRLYARSTEPRPTNGNEAKALMP